jgi:two-component system, LytTR family, response regulator
VANDAVPSWTAGAQIRTLIVDDEPLARQGIRARLRKDLDVEVIGEAGDGPSAARAIKTLKPDLVFLDIQMPGCSGFDVLERTSTAHLAVVIFVTAYDRYAVRAFETHALDYLLKPIDGKRFRDAVERARRELAKEEALRLRHQRTTALLDEQREPADRPAASVCAAGGKPAVLQRLAVRDGDRFILLKADEIEWVQASANYVEVHARGRSYLLRVTMNELERKLDRPRFVRIHRSIIVNADRIQEIRPYSHGDFEVWLANGAALPLSRRYRARLLP